MFFGCYFLEKKTVVFLSVQKTIDKILTIFDICATSDFMVRCFYFRMLFDQKFHFVFQELFEEKVDQTYVNPLLFFLQFLAHSFHHNLLNFLFPFFSFNNSLVTPV